MKTNKIMAMLGILTACIRSEEPIKENSVIVRRPVQRARLIRGSQLGGTCTQIGKQLDVEEI